MVLNRFMLDLLDAVPIGDPMLRRLTANERGT